MELWTEEEQETPQEVELTEEVVFAPRGNQRCIDDLNTNEQVYIAAPISGPYTLLVRGAKSGGSSQKYVLIWSQSCSLGDDHTMNVEANTSDRSE